MSATTGERAPVQPLRRLFVDHPRAVGESYWQHARIAGRFGAAMIGGGLACVIHALVPGLFASTASARVKQLYAEMRARQPNFSDKRPDFEDKAWLAEYEI